MSNLDKTDSSSGDWDIESENTFHLLKRMEILNQKFIIRKSYSLNFCAKELKFLTFPLYE